jgi:hypothetical protein
MVGDGTSTQLSPQALTLYKRMLEDTVFIKRQQWATTNYAALIYAAIIWLAHNWAIPGGIACVLIGFSGVTAAIGIGLLMRFQFDLCELRKRGLNMTSGAIKHKFRPRSCGNRGRGK